MTRAVCRQCAATKPAATAAGPPASTTRRAVETGRSDSGGAVQQPQRLPPGSVWADTPEQQRPALRIAALEKARAAANAAGAPGEAIAAMDQQLDMRAELARSRPLDARLDSAKAKLAKA